MFFGYASMMISLARNILLVPIYLHAIPLAEYGAWLATGGALGSLTRCCYLWDVPVALSLRS